MKAALILAVLTLMVSQAGADEFYSRSCEITVTYNGAVSPYTGWNYSSALEGQTQIALFDCINNQEDLCAAKGGTSTVTSQWVMCFRHHYDTQMQCFGNQIMLCRIQQPEPASGGIFAYDYPDSALDYPESTVSQPDEYTSYPGYY